MGVPWVVVLWMGLQASSPASDDPFGPLRDLPGRWEGAIDGRLGTGKGLRVYEFINDGKFLLARHSSVRPAQEKSPEGDHHQELALFSHDTERGTIMLREFMSEGVIPLSACEVEERRVRCVAESVENGEGIRARLTLDFVGPHEFVETYELAFPGDPELLHYFTNRWTRVPSVDDD